MKSCVNYFKFFAILGVVCFLGYKNAKAENLLFCPDIIYEGSPAKFNAPRQIIPHLLMRNKPILPEGRISCRVYSELPYLENFIHLQEIGDINGSFYIVNYANYNAQLQKDTHAPFLRGNDDDYQISCRTDKYDRKKVCWLYWHNISLGYDKNGKYFMTITPPAPVLELKLLLNTADGGAVYSGNITTGFHHDQIQDIIQKTDANWAISFGNDDFSPEFTMENLENAVKLTKILWDLPPN